MANSLQKGVVVIIASLSLAILLLMSAYLLSFTVAESRISQSQTVSMETYYLAEAGINEAIWKLKNDSAWRSGFEEEPGCATWQASFERNYSADSSVAVSVQNFECARGEIVATSTIGLSGGKSSQRVVKVKVLKALGSLTENSPIFSGAPSGQSDIQASTLRVYDGNIFINSNLNIKLWSTVSLYDNEATDEKEGKVLTVGNNNVVWSTLNAEAVCASNVCNTTSTCGCLDSIKFQECMVSSCPPYALEAPAIDFDSDDLSSYKSRAQLAQQQGQCSVVGKNSGGAVATTSSNCLFSEQEFSDLLWEIGQGGTLTLEYQTNGEVFSVYYVEGGVDLKGERYLEVNGVLVADATVNIGEKSRWGSDFGFNQITINDPGTGIPSGLLTKGKINFGLYSSFESIEATGLIYSQDEIRMTSMPEVFTVTGGIIARKFSLTSAWNPLNIYLDNDIIREGVWGGSQPPEGERLPYSPVVTVEHWEESY